MGESNEEKGSETTEAHSTVEEDRRAATRGVNTTPVNFWCNSQWRHFRESVMDLARALRVKVKECPNSSYLDRWMLVEVSGLCHECSARIEDCDQLFEELLGFEGHFVTPLSSSLVEGQPPFQLGYSILPATRQYRHHFNVSYLTTEKILDEGSENSPVAS